MSEPPLRPSPFRLTPILFEKIWGGRRLERFGRTLPPGARIGESWELADLPSTSRSGAGGGEARTLIADGPLAGRPLRDAVAAWGRALLGDARPTPAGDFPLLVKLLDARENLSVQVHPSPAYARAHPDAAIKTECWVVLDAEPGARIYAGVRAGITREAFEARVADGSVVGALRAVRAVPGTCHVLPSGTVHALGAGVLVAEVQTPGDTTFRLYDWGRTGRAMHVTEALASLDLVPPPEPTRVDDRPGAAVRLAETPFFALDGLTVASPTPCALSPVCTVLMVIEGVVEVRSTTDSFQPVSAPLGATVLIPAAVAPACQAVPRREAKLLRVTLANG